MKTSVSEIKNFLENRRNWFFSGRNAMYLRPKLSTSALRLGGAFHDVLECFYAGIEPDLNTLIQKYNLNKPDQKILLYQARMYKDVVLANDLKDYEIIEPEMQYSIQIQPDVELFGFMDVVYRNKKNGKYGILEHKFVKRPRPEAYNNLEEQVKTYELALREIYGDQFDGVILNQIIKSDNSFQNIRTKHSQTEQQLNHFRSKLSCTVDQMKIQSRNPYVPYSPHWANIAFDPYYPLNLKMDRLGTDDTRVITEEDIKKAGLVRRG